VNALPAALFEEGELRAAGLERVGVLRPARLVTRAAVLFFAAGLCWGVTLMDEGLQHGCLL
jgi:hypothetical protein